jgi:hypothetical protein
LSDHGNVKKVLCLIISREDDVEDISLWSVKLRD